jgi:hypothetical protein
MKSAKNEGHMPEDKFLVMSRKGKRLGVAFACRTLARLARPFRAGATSGSGVCLE